MPPKADHPRRAAKTTPAAAYCGVSASYLRKLRLKGPADPGERGPRYTKLTPFLVVYDYADLDRWIESRRAASAAA